MQLMTFKALFTGQRAGLLGLALMACVGHVSASDYQVREAYFKANTGRALDVLLDASLSSRSAFEWRKSTIDTAYIRTLAALDFGLPNLAKDIANKNSSQSNTMISLALAEGQYTAGDYVAALNTLTGVNYLRGIQQAEAQYLRGQIYIATADMDAAKRLFKKWKGNDPLQAYLGLNIGIWHAEKNNLNEAALWLAKTAAMPLPATEEWDSLKDRANVYLGGVYNWMGKPAMARNALQKVRLSGVDANRALLSLGWTDTARSKIKEALAPWSYLSEQSQSDASVQEAYLLVPFALGRLEAHGKAANFFNKTIRKFDQELAVLNKAKLQSKDGSLLKRIGRVYQDKPGSWEASLRQAAGPHLATYLIEALKQEELYGLLKSYMEIEEMRSLLGKSNSANKSAAQGLRTKMASLQQAYARPINSILEQEMISQIKRLQEYKSHANFSLAESYERVANSSAWEQ